MHMESVRENFLRRSFANHTAARRHNKRQDELLEEKHSFYQRQIQLTDLRTHFAERRLERHAENKLGLVVMYKSKPLEPSPNREFYYLSSNQSCKAKEYSVEPLFRILQHRNRYGCKFERRCKEYVEDLQQQKYAQDLRMEKLMNTTNNFKRDEFDSSIDWRTSEDARVRLPPLHNSRRKYSPNVRFSFDM